MVVVGLALTVPGLAQVTPDDIAKAERVLSEARARMQVQAEAFRVAYARQSVLADQLVAVEAQLQEAGLEREAAQAAARQRAVELYTGIALDPQMLPIIGSQEPVLAASYAQYQAEADDRLLARLDQSLTEVVGARDRAQETLKEQAAINQELAEITMELSRDLAIAQAQLDSLKQQYRVQELQRLEAEAAAATSTTAPPQTRAPSTSRPPTTTLPPPATVTSAPPSTSPPVTSVVPVASEPAPTQPTVSGPNTISETTVPTTLPPTSTTVASAGAMVCPVQGAVAFVDSWGDPRSGGRSHQGVDMLAARGTPAVAIEAGTILRMSTSSLGGITLWLKGASGDQYYYAHLDGYASGIKAGQAVEVGAVIASVGSTGNAPASTPHLHFELHPGGGSAINAYPLIKSLCG